MTTVILIGKILLFILCVLVIAVVAAQKPADDNPGAAFGQGNMDSDANKMKSRTVEGKLNNMTKIGGIAVGVLSFALVLMQSML